ncbi:MAG: phospho-N-acetylmuramoyl-pentapeptide-transferase [Candidatus Dormibacteraceae bacterium]
MLPDVLTLAVSFLVGLALYRPLIGWLARRQAVQVIQAELPAGHQAKAGTPTGGGAIFAAVPVVGGLLAFGAGHPGPLTAVAGLVVGALLGAADDARKLRIGSLGIPARAKLPLQVALAVPVAWLAHQGAGGHQMLVPVDLGLWYWPLAVFAIVGAANAVNLTDGMDGLAAGLGMLALAGLAFLIPGAPAGEKAVALTLIGCLAAFLAYNRHPARVFMGDTGSLALGYALAGMAIQQGAMFLLPILGSVFVLETLSVIIQVGYFKASGGRRVFKMAPIHYTFHLAGWSENRVVRSFWGAGAVSLALAAAVARAFG